MLRKTVMAVALSGVTCGLPGFLRCFVSPLRGSDRIMRVYPGAYAPGYNSVAATRLMPATEAISNAQINDTSL